MAGRKRKRRKPQLQPVLIWPEPKERYDPIRPGWLVVSAELREVGK